MAYLIALIGIVIGIAGLIWTTYQSRKSSRRQLTVRLTKEYSLWPKQMDHQLDKVLEMSFRKRPINNLMCLELTFHLSGHRDQNNPKLRSLPGPTDPPRPQIDFTNFRILAVGTRNNDPNIFDIPIGRAENDTRLYPNIVRLKSSTDAIFSILGTKENPDNDITVAFTKGYLQDIDIVPLGLLCTE